MSKKQEISENLIRLQGTMKNINGYKETAALIWCDNMSDRHSFAVVGDPAKISDAFTTLFMKRMNGQASFSENFLYSAIITAIASCDKMVIEDIKKVCLEVAQLKKASLN